MAKLTKAQQRYLDEIRAKPGKVYNGRGRKPLTALRDAGLITYDFTLVPHANIHGSGMSFTEEFTCFPTTEESV